VKIFFDEKARHTAKWQLSLNILPEWKVMLCFYPCVKSFNISCMFLGNKLNETSVPKKYRKKAVYSTAFIPFSDFLFC